MTSSILSLVITCSIIGSAVLIFFILSRSKSSSNANAANDNNDDIKQQGAATKPVSGALATQQQSQNNGRSGRGASSSNIHKTLISDVAHRESLSPSSGHRGLQGSAQDINIKFRGLILYSGYNTTYTEIDEVIVSPYGIFCIEYKDHLGDIFGNKQNKHWVQHKPNKESSQLFNPARQNYKHVKALEQLLGNRIHGYIHNAVIFTNADSISSDSKQVFCGLDKFNAFLQRHTKMIYSIDEYTEICKILVSGSASSPRKAARHVNEVRAYRQHQRSANQLD